MKAENTMKSENTIHDFPLLCAEGVVVSTRENTVDWDNSYYGCLLDRWTVYSTARGLIEKHEWRRGAGLERSGTDYQQMPA